MGRQIRPHLSNKPAHHVESLVRGKNTAYRRWRKGKRWETLDAWCTECLMRFGTLPYWIEYAECRRAASFRQADAYHAVQAQWRRELKAWALEKGIVRYPAQAAQFYRYYSAWYRYKWEKEHGEITRSFARQMY